MSPKKLLVVHAGTHKTATTYIQDRLGANQGILRKNKVLVLSHETKKVGRFYKLATLLKEKSFRRVSRILNSTPEDIRQVVVSDERLTKVLIQEELLDGLLYAVKRSGFRLRVVFFLRDQPDYINSLYIQEIKRLYHAQDIQRYSKRCMRKLNDRFNYNLMFSDLIDRPKIRAQFIPFGVGGVDPFDSFMDSQGWRSKQGWNPASAGIINDQPGVKGVWLARQVRKRLEAINANCKYVRGQSRFIDKYVRANSWHKEKYYGFDQKRVNIIRTFYKNGNDQFAQKVWGKSWEDVYQFPHRSQKSFELADLDDSNQIDLMQEAVDLVIQDIRAEKPQAFESSD